MLLAKSVLSCHADPTHVACATTARAWVLLVVVCPGQQRRGALSGPLPGERGQCPAASCRLHGRCGGRGTCPPTPLCHSSWETMEVPGETALRPHGATSRPSRVRLWTGPPQAPGNTTGCHLNGESHAQGQSPLGARPCSSFLRPTLRLSGPHRATSTAREAVSCCVWGMRELYGSFMT